MTREEIISNHTGKTVTWIKNFSEYKITHLRSSVILEMMDEWAKHIAIEFAKWVDKSEYELSTKDFMWYRSTLDFDVKTSDQLFQLFLNDINK